MALTRTRMIVAALLGGAPLLAACASDLGADSYSRGQVGQVARIEEGVVEGVRQVQVEGTKSGVGSAAGGAAGAVIGGQFGGGGAERAVGAIAGAVLGGLGGAAAEEAATRQTAFAYTIRLNDGRLISITQTDDQAIPVGTAVLIERGSRTRVVPR